MHSCLSPSQVRAEEMYVVNMEERRDGDSGEWRAKSCHGSLLEWGSRVTVAKALSQEQREKWSVCVFAGGGEKGAHPYFKSAGSGEEV